jgi:hypothetical protein
MGGLSGGYRQGAIRVLCALSALATGPLARLFSRNVDFDLRAITEKYAVWKAQDGCILSVPCCRGVESDKASLVCYSGWLG